jgi:sialidase-1
MSHLLVLLLCWQAMGNGVAAQTPSRSAGIGDARAQPEASHVTLTNVFLSGLGGYHTYRIPALLATPRSTLLAFAEGRKSDTGDAGDIDLVLRRSTDLGRSWQPMQRVRDDGLNTCGNPCPILDRQTGMVWLLLTWNRGDDREPDIIAQRGKDTRRVFVAHSADDGLTWSKPREITDAVKPTHWTWFATGPGAGIQIERGPHRGRLVVPCDHIEAGTRRSGVMLNRTFSRM